MAGEPKAQTERRKFAPFTAIDPESGTRIEVHVTEDRAKWIASKGKGAVMEMAHTVKEVLAAPKAIYDGIRWDEDQDRGNKTADGWVCYCGHPRFYYEPNNTQPQSSGNKEVFLVFVNKDRIVYQWRWEDADEDGTGLPRGHHARFCKKVL